MPSDIQVFVRWKDETIFAGEDVECIITFKNVADNNPEFKNSGHHTPQQSHHRKPSRGIVNSTSDSLFSLKSPLFSSSRRSNPASPLGRPSHRISTSVSSPLTGSHSFPPPSTPRSAQSPGHKHKRSVSIFSIDSENGEKTPVSATPFNWSRPPRGHGRSASVQVLPKRTESYEESLAKGGRSPIRGPDSPHNPSPTHLKVDSDRSMRTRRSGYGAPSPITPTESSRAPGRRPQLPPIDFKFPAAPPPANENNRSAVESEDVPNSAISAKSNSGLSQGQVPQLARIISTSSLTGSHRSSGEFYSVSDRSSETLQSEYTSYSIPGSRPIPARHSRHFSSVEPSTKSANSQTLLMGYAQLSASFTVDGSLINQSAFEDVKRKGVVGGQGNGPGTGSGASAGNKSRKGGGFWGALRWNNIEESINGLLSNNELDGLRDMRGVSSSRSIPLLSTSQSLLFVDLRLAPGEEQSYSFSFTLPSGLPASHKGKAIKISYNLVIGTQRPSGSNEPQRVNRISIPFRVFSGVNARGDVLGHDLMSPYVLLRDEARVQKVGSSPLPTPKPQSIGGPTWKSAPEFLSYVDEILEQRARDNSLLPPDTPLERQISHDISHGSISCKDAIDLAILRSNQSINSSRSPNRFEIARNGRRIAVVVLNRPAHRLGETIIATIDFAGAALPCYALRATLETSEKVAPHLAVRSNASIHRATHRVHASFFETTLYSTRVVFSPAVPISATPSILTSGINYEWELRFEFVTTSLHGDAGSRPSGSRLLEAVSVDDRGHILAGSENLGCESFEIAIPLTVYGETVREKPPEEHEGYSI